MAKVEQLSAYERAVILAPKGELRCYAHGSIDETSLPALIPYAVLGTSTSAGPKSSQRFLAKRADKTLHPDVIIFHQGTPYYAGSVGSASAFSTGSGAMAVGFSAPVYETPIYAVCYRVAPARVGLRWDETGMVVWASDNARAAGLLEGDRIVSINQAPVEFGEKALRSGYHARLLALQPGADVQLIWIRPGTGRMEGLLTAEVNPPAHLDLPGMDMSPPRISEGSY